MKRIVNIFNVLFLVSALFLTACGDDNPTPDDTTPDNFSFESQADVALATDIDSSVVTITGLTVASPISVANGSYSINGAGFTSTQGTISNNQSVVVRVTSSSQPSTDTEATLTIGGVSGVFTVTTLAPDTTPEAFSFSPQSDVALSAEVDSAAVSISGISGATPISVTNGSYSIDGGSFTDVAGTITNNQTVAVRVTSAATNSTDVEAALNIGGVSASFIVTTLDDLTPEAFTFDSKTDSPIGIDSDSDAVTITGLSAPTPISISNGSYSIDGSSFTSLAGTINNNQSVVVRVPSSNQFETLTESVLTVGGVSATFSVTTIKAFFFSADNGEVGLEMWVSDGTEAGTRLTKDINTTKADSDISSLTEFNGELYLIANDGKTGPELRKLNTVTGSTELVKNINSASNVSGPSELTVVGNLMYFQASGTFNRYDLWKSDGTEAGTEKIIDINTTIQNTAAVGETLFFTVNNFPGSDFSDELWKSDGTEAGTVLVKDFNGAEFTGLDASPASLTALGNTLYFVSEDTVNGRELWKSDGTEAGTVIVKDISPFGDSNPDGLITLGNTLYFSANNTTNGIELWKSDGTEAGTVIVRDISATSSSFPRTLLTVGNTLYFSANFGELWKTDGTEIGTVFIKDLAPDPVFAFVVRMFSVDSTVFMSVFDDTNGTELWKTDGTEAGTVLVKDIYPGLDTDSSPFNSSPFGFSALNNKLYFSANDGINGRELWTSDGTEAGTVLVTDIRSGADGSSPFTSNVVLNNILYFLADDGASGRELWQTDGTQAGTLLVEDINAATVSSQTFLFVTLNGASFFPASDGANGIELWKSDGSEAGTVMVKDMNPTGDGIFDNESLTSSFFANDDKLFFPATNGVDGIEIWVSDGTDAGTQMLADINTIGDSSPEHFVAIGNIVYFRAYDGNSVGIWRTDGTVAGTTLVKNIYTGTQSIGSRVNRLIAVNDTFYFSGDDGINGAELWKSDGTEAGTVMVVDLIPGAASSFPTDFGVIGDTIYFGTLGATPGLYKSDGTAAGTVLLKNLSLDDIENTSTIGDTLYFLANDGISGNELWKTDGTEAGTVQVKDINPGSGGSSPFSITVLDDALYFAANDGINGEELWTSDGTEAGTVLLKDLYEGPNSSEPGIVKIGEKLYVLATTELGAEFWTSDGTEAGTVILKDINEGSESSIY